MLMYLSFGIIVQRFLKCLHTLFRSQLSLNVCNASMQSQFINKHIIRSVTQKCASNWMEQQKIVNLIVVMRKYSWCVIVKLIERCWYTAWPVKRASMQFIDQNVKEFLRRNLFSLLFLHSWWAQWFMSIVCGFFSEN